MNSLSGKFEVKIKGKKYTCHLSMNAFRILCEREEIRFNEMQDFLQEKPLTAVPKVIYYGIENDLILNKKSLDGLPDFEYFAANILEDQDSLEMYTEKIGLAFGGEDPGNK